MRTGSRSAAGRLRGVRGVLVVIALAVGCERAHGVSLPMLDKPTPRPLPEPFLAMERDFADFRTWPRWEIPDIGMVSGHEPGEPRYVYVRGVVPKAGRRFAVGTILVKSLERGPPERWELHAMVKRGGGYNAGGAEGWEWFDLAWRGGRPVVTWRGLGTEEDHGGYGPNADDGTPIGCNGCHALVASTDHVFTAGHLRAHAPERRGH